MTPRLKGALLLTLAFALGVAAGALGLGALQARREWGQAGPGPHGPRSVLRQLDRELALTSPQREQIEAILREAGREFAQLREETGPRFRDIRSRSRARIREVLDPAQRETFDTLAARLDERLRRRPGRPPGLPEGR
jgi:Spy/CpxP family protein refolding chaperone